MQVLNQQVTLNKTAQKKWYDNVLLFLAPVGIVYISAVVGVIQANNGAIKPEDLLPTSFTLGAITLYVLNSVLDYLRKLRA